ncbi:hypothetical protein FH972_022217 [Carpinus fangiana]|uniref:Uncharacterized protein n=1 Tax=Carpinus fangiana TaxID=176857 RepID=A0A5N6KS82_9ROSI|nr:hypothetical protein FH972_022217 [Carpinus fangiana]
MALLPIGVQQAHLEHLAAASNVMRVRLSDGSNADCARMLERWRCVSGAWPWEHRKFLPPFPTPPSAGCHDVPIAKGPAD